MTGQLPPPLPTIHDLDDVDIEDGEIVYYATDAPKIMALRVANNLVSVVFYLALVFFAYNCDWCGGPRMW